MKYIGIHVDATPDLSFAPEEAAKMGAKAFALTLADPSRYRSPAIVPEVADAFRLNCERYGFGADVVLPHAGFVINLASPDAQKLKLSKMALADEMRRASLLGLTMLNFHPGSHLNRLSEAEALERVGLSINAVLAETEGVTAVIENTAGQGTSLGYSFRQLADIIAVVDDRSRVGVCVDTAHAFAAGYNLADDAGYDACWAEFEATVGFGCLRGMHINDSGRALGSRIDRHATTGEGAIGEHFFRRLMADTRFDGMPLILETPDPLKWAAEIERLYSWTQQ